MMEAPGFDPNAEGGGPLRVSIELGFLDIASQLLATGADPNAAAGERKCPIVLALENEYFDLADYMLSQGAEISIRDHNGWTPLIWAAIKGRKEVVEFLIERGADIHVCSNDGWNAITGAFFRNHTQIVRALASKGAKFGKKYQEAALLSAYEQGSLDVVEALIAEGASVNIGTSEGQPLLILVLARGDIKMLDLLLTAGADVNIRDTNGNPALVSAILNAQYTAAARLVKHGASVNVKGPKWAAIHAAAQCGRTDLCKLLLEAGASVDQLGEASHTALMLASKEEHVETVRLLLNNGADPNRKNKAGLTPFGIAPSKYGSGRTATEAVLREFGGK
nr:ankyrin repeat domain-containing protein [Limimaricola sp. G21655-S1]